jgi:energy-coupling factor transporter ATP-binding protein EcfA2
MYLNKISIQNIRSISSFEMTFEKPAGWHVIIGDNGAGKSTIVRSIALGIIGPSDAKALRINLSDWINRSEIGLGEISLKVQKHPEDSKIGQSPPLKRLFEAKVSIKKIGDSNYTLEGSTKDAPKNIWSNANGWFSCAFGPFRRFTGGEKEWMKVYYSDPRAAAHLSVFGEDVALTEAIDWLKNLHIKSLEKALDPKNAPSQENLILESLKSFLNEGNLLPHGAKLDSISSEGVFFIDGNGIRVDVAQMSDGYRSILSLTFELIRQMVRAYGDEAVFRNFRVGDYSIDLPGVVLIDEIDAHLHPSWQARIGQWFLEVFPAIQFIVTTHSPLICRASENGSIWRLSAPGSDIKSGEVVGTDKDRLLFGDLLDAYGTELFGRNITQSKTGQEISESLASLNMKSFKQKLTDHEKVRLETLKTITTNMTRPISSLGRKDTIEIELEEIKPIVLNIEYAILKNEPVKLSKNEVDFLKNISSKDAATTK